MLQTAPFMFGELSTSGVPPPTPREKPDPLPQPPLQLWCGHVTWTPPIRVHEPSIGRGFLVCREALMRITIQWREVELSGAAAVLVLVETPMQATWMS